MSRYLFRTRRAQGDHGAVLVVVAITMTALVSMAAFAVNLGSISLKRRDLQADADAIALDLGRSLDGRLTTAYAGAADWLAEIDASRARNNFPASGTETDGIRDLLVEPGCFVQASYTVDTACVVADAVKVTATDDVSEFFRFTNGTTSRSAIGRAGEEPIAEISIGSKLASLDLDSPSILNPLLTELLGTATPVNLTLLGYQGLASADVTLGDLAAELGFGTVDALLAAPNINVGDLLTASATVLGIGNPATVILNNLALQTDASYEISLGDLVSVADGGEEAAANATINVFDLLMGTAQLADGDSFVSIPNLQLIVPGLVTGSLSLTLIEPPRIAIGPAAIGAGGDWVTQATTAQLDVALNLDIVGTIDMAIGLGAAQGIAKLTEINCAGPDPDLSTVTVEAQTTAATATALVTLILPFLPPVPIADANLPLSGAPPTDLFFTGPYPTPPPGQPVAAVGLGLGTSLLGDLSVLGSVPLGTILSVLSPVTTQVDLLIFDPLFEALGLSVAGADNRVLGVFDCDTGGSPLLVG